MMSRRRTNPRYDSEVYLSEWQIHGVYPNCHRDLFQLVCYRATGQSFLDMGCGTGLFGSRVARYLRDKPVSVVGIDSSKSCVALAEQYGITSIMPITNLRLHDSESLLKLKAIIEAMQIDTVIARRSIGEMCDGRPEFSSNLVKTIHDAGVKEIFLEGRKFASIVAARTLYPTVDEELALFTPLFPVVEKFRQCAYLKKAA